MIKLNRKQYMATFVAGAALLCMSQGVEAAGFQLKEQSAEGQGNSFAGSTAKAYDASTIFFNPAGMTRLKGNKTDLNVSYIAPKAKFKLESNSGGGTRFTNTSEQDGGVGAFVPSMYGMWDYSPELKFGVSVNTPFGLSTQYDQDWVGGQYNRRSAIETITVTPSVAYKVNNNLSVGGGVAIEYISGELTRTAHTTLGGEVELNADDLAAGFTAGILYEFSDATRVGLSYRSRIKHKLEGHVKVQNASNNAVNNYYRAYADLTLPDVLSFGAYHQFDDKWSVMGDVAWTNWSVFKDLTVVDKTGVNADSVTEYHWDDTYFTSLGVNYQYNDQWKLQTGVAFDTGAANDEYRNAGIPDSDRFWMSVGSEYKFDETFSARIGYSHIIGDDAKVSETGKGSSYSGTFETGVNIVTVGLNVSF